MTWYLDEAAVLWLFFFFLTFQQIDRGKGSTPVRALYTRVKSKSINHAEAGKRKLEKQVSLSHLHARNKIDKKLITLVLQLFFALAGESSAYFCLFPHKSLFLAS